MSADQSGSSEIILAPKHKLRHHHEDCRQGNTKKLTTTLAAGDVGGSNPALR